MNLNGKTALITGGSRGIGKAIALRYAAEGADLFLNATSLDNLHKAKAEIQNVSPDCRVEVYTADVSDRDSMEKMVAEAISSMGGIDILVNNAGVYKPALFVDYTPEDFDWMMKVNLYGVFHISQFVVRHMMEEGWGRIINISSVAGKWASYNQSVYNASKHGVVALTRCLALETATQGITVNAICPGVVETDMVDNLLKHAELQGTSAEEAKASFINRIAMRRWLEPEEITGLALYLASDESSGMTGQSILIDAGMLFV